MKRSKDDVTHLGGNRWIKACKTLQGLCSSREERRRPIVPIIDILGLGKHGPLKLSQKHTRSLKAKTSHHSAGDEYMCVCVCPVDKCVYSITPWRNKWAEGRDRRNSQREELN